MIHAIQLIFIQQQTIPMVASAALAIIFSQSTFVINVNIENTKFEKAMDRLLLES